MKKQTHCILCYTVSKECQKILFFCTQLLLKVIHFLSCWKLFAFSMQFSDAFNNDLILQTLRDILAGKKCEIPVYDFKTNSRYMLYVLYNVLHVFNGSRLSRIT